MFDFKIKQWMRAFGLQPFMCWVDPPSSYTTHYSLKKYNDGDDPGAAALNDDKDIIDSYIYSASLTNLTATAPLSRSGDNMSLQYDTANLKVVANKLTTIQSLNTAASPTFENLTVNDDVTIGLSSNDQALLFVSGAIFVRGVGAFLGDFYTSGSVWITGNTNQTGSHYVSASFVTRKLIVNPKATGSGYIGSITASEEDYLQGIGLPPQYDAFISGSILLSGNTTITGSLTVNGTAYMPIIDFGGGNKITQSGADSMVFEIPSSSFDYLESDNLKIIGSASFNNSEIHIGAYSSTGSRFYMPSQRTQFRMYETTPYNSRMVLYTQGTASAGADYYSIFDMDAVMGYAVTHYRASDSEQGNFNINQLGAVSMTSTNQLSYECVNSAFDTESSLFLTSTYAKLWSTGSVRLEAPVVNVTGSVDVQGSVYQTVYSTSLMHISASTLASQSVSVGGTADYWMVSLRHFSMGSVGYVNLSYMKTTSGRLDVFVRNGGLSTASVYVDIMPYGS